MQQVANQKGFYIINEEGIKAEPKPSPNTNVTSRMLLKYNAQGTTTDVCT